MMCTSTRLLPNPVRWFATEFASSFKMKAASKLQLNEFYKFTHPDVLSNAPPAISKVNADSIQSLNSYLQSVQQVSADVQASKLTFFVLPPPVKGQSEETKQPESDQYKSIEVELLPLRADSSYSLR